MAATFFTGFSTCKDFLEAIDRFEVVNLSVGHREISHDRKYGLGIEGTFLTMSQVSGGEVLYFSSIVHRYRTIGGKPMDHDGQVPKIAAQVEEFAIRFLKENEIKFRRALVAMPKSYVMLDGTTGFLKYNGESREFEYTG